MSQNNLPITTPLTEADRLDRLNALLDEILPANAFHRRRLGERRRVETAEDYVSLPFLTKQELAEDTAAHPPYGSNLTYPLERYTRYHQTSGTTGTPLRILDTEQTWQWWGRCWLEVYKAAGVTARDTIYFAFSFAPSIGFWSSYKAGEMLGALLVAGGGASTQQRLRTIFDIGATVLMCTPSYALRMAEVAEEQGFSLSDGPVRVLIHAGEPGASIPHTRRQIEQAFGAQVIDHAGATEVGAWGIGTADGRGLYVNEDEFIAEVLEPGGDRPVEAGQEGELVITNLGRGAWPVIRYRTGDIVRPVREPAGEGGSRLLLEGGVLGRTDDMLIIRGVNVYPSAIENLVRQVAGRREFRVMVARRRQLDELTIELEGDQQLCRQLADQLRQQIGIRIEVRPVPVGSLPRWEAKHRRVVITAGDT